MTLRYVGLLLFMADYSCIESFAKISITELD